MPTGSKRVMVALGSFHRRPWALNDQGIRCIIAPSFADIFFNKRAVLRVAWDEFGQGEEWKMPRNMLGKNLVDSDFGPHNCQWMT